MIQEAINGQQAVKGTVRSHRIFEHCDTLKDTLCYGLANPRTRVASIGQPYAALPGIWRPQGQFANNDILYDWATAVCELLRGAPDGKQYKVSAMYLEFENNSGAAVSPPAYSRDEGVSYYTSLSSSPERDYLRVPLTAATLTSTDEDLFPRGNRLTFFAQTEGTAGINGKPYDSASQSRLYGGALVVTPDFTDPAQDLIFARFYWSDTADQMIKLVGSQCGLEWRETLQ